MSANRPVIALTGATGFVGKRVAAALLAQDYNVKALVRPGSASKRADAASIDWTEGRLNDSASEAALCRGADMVIHMAGLTTAKTRAEYQRVNSAAVGRLAAAAQKAGAQRFIYLSSMAARAPHLSSYAWSKYEGEEQLAANAGAMKTAIVRAPAVIGAGDKATAPINALIAKGVLPAPGGRNWRERKLALIHVDDLADVLAGPCLAGAYDGQVFSPSTKACLSWPEFAAESAAALGRPVRAVPLPLSLLYPTAALTSALKALTGRGHLTREKLREFLHNDWSAPAEFQSGTGLQSAIKKTIKDG